MFDHFIEKELCKFLTSFLIYGDFLHSRCENFGPQRVKDHTTKKCWIVFFSCCAITGNNLISIVNCLVTIAARMFGDMINVIPVTNNTFSSIYCKIILPIWLENFRFLLIVEASFEIIFNAIGGGMDITYNECIYSLQLRHYTG